MEPMVKIRLDAEEKAEWEAAAKAANMTLSNWVRKAARQFLEPMDESQEAPSKGAPKKGKATEDDSSSKMKKTYSNPFSSEAP